MKAHALVQVEEQPDGILEGVGDQSSGVRFPDDINICCEHLPLLFRAPVTVALLGREPEERSTPCQS
jgi:hypothetical protein